MGRKKTTRQNVMAQVKLRRIESHDYIWIASDELFWIVELNGESIGYVTKYKNRHPQVYNWRAYLWSQTHKQRQRGQHVGTYRNGSTDPADMTYDPTAAKKRAVEELLVAYDRSLDS